MEEEKDFFDDFSGGRTSAFYALPQSGSSRKNFIAETDQHTYVVTRNDNLRENESFFYFSEVFSNLSLNTPKIYKISVDRKTYIQQYLGSKTLSEIIQDEGLSERVKILVKETLSKLHHLQKVTIGKIDYSRTFEYEKYDSLPILHDLNYFKFFFADILEIPYHKSTLLKEFNTLAQSIVNIKPKVLMIRDFQARNIMVDENNGVYFIDYQAAMEGPAMYDMVSFLYQAKANFPDEFKGEMLDFYISLFDGETERQSLRKSVLPIRLLRNLQVLGAYGFRGLVQKKEHFIKSIDQGIKNLIQTSQSWDEMGNYPELRDLIQRLNTDAEEKIKKLITAGIGNPLFLK